MRLQVGGEPAEELSRILRHGQENLARVVGETKQWFDPKDGARGWIVRAVHMPVV